MSDGDALARAAGLIARFPACRVLVVGDIMLDEFVFGTVGRISPEAPVPVVAVTRDARVPGGAANVARNIAGLRAGVLLAGLVGNDAAGRDVSRMLRKQGVGVSAVVADRDRPTTVKTRVIAHSQQVVRVDREQKGLPSRKTHDALMGKVLAALEGVDGVVFSDYRKGALSEELVRREVRQLSYNFIYIIYINVLCCLTELIYKLPSFFGAAKDVTARRDARADCHGKGSRSVDIPT